MKSALLVLEATIGGTRRHLRDLAMGLVRDGWKLDIAYSNERDEGFATDLGLFKNAGIGLHEIKMKRGFSLLSDICAIIRLRSLIKRLSPAVVHAHSTKAGLVGRLASLFLPPARIYSPHCFAFNMRSKLAWLYRLMERLLAPCTDMLIAVCGTEALDAAAVGHRKGHVKVVYNGIESHVGKVADKEPGTIAFIGRADKQKGLPVLIDAFKILKSRHIPAKLKVMSNVADRQKAELLEIGAEILPFSQHEKAMELLRESEIVAIPSLWEAFPYLVLESFDAETAIVASDVGGIAEATSDTAALLVPPDSPHHLAEALGRVLTDKNLRLSLTCEGKKALDSFTAKAMVKAIEGVYERYCASRT